MTNLPAETRKRAIAQELRNLKELAATASNDAEAREITSRIAQVARKYRIQEGIGLPSTPVAQAMEIEPEYRRRPHLDYLSDQISDAVRDVENGQSRMLAVSMPPRAGKSYLVSRHTPLWLLRRHPEWEIITASYDKQLTTDWARNIRETIEERPDLGIAIKKDGGAGGRWETVEGGGMFATAVRGAATGRGSRVFIIDDPVKDYVEAHSERSRQALWDWWLTVAQTRLMGPYLVIVVMCMTGDTPVLRPNGTTIPLKNIRPGDEVATFTDEGEVVTSVVTNWMSQGEDDIFTLHLASGRKVRANARHPFWVIDEDGNGSWVRLGLLRAGMRVRSLTAPIGESSAPLTDATSQRNARECVCRTTPEQGMQQGIGPRQLPPKNEGRFDLRGVMDSLRTSTTPSLQHKTSDVPFVENMSGTPLNLPTGQTYSALTTTTRQEMCGACSAMTATSSLLAGTRPMSSGGPLNTWSVSTDEVLFVEASGREEVFDIEVSGTHRFIANGLDVSNTRWHEDDFVGRLLSKEYAGDPKDWTRIILPALSEGPGDALGRSEGGPLLTPTTEETESQAVARWATTRSAVGEYTWASMFQQRPAPASGAIFDASWWKFWTNNPENARDDGSVVYIEPGTFTGGRWIDSWDCTFKGETNSKKAPSSDYVVGQRWVRNGPNRYLIAQQRGRWSFTQTIDRMRLWTEGVSDALNPHGHFVHERLIEDKANGTAIIDVLKEHVSGIKPVNPTVGKEGRARAVTPEIESGHVYLPYPKDEGNEWVNDLLGELRDFPHAAHDDQVDSLTQALAGLRDPGRGRITVPGLGAQGAARGPAAMLGRSISRPSLGSGRTYGM